MVTVGLSAAALVAIAVSAVYGSRRIRAFSTNADSAILGDLAGYVASGALRPVLTASTRWPTSCGPRAFEQGGVLGKHVIAVPVRPPASPAGSAGEPLSSG